MNRFFQIRVNVISALLISAVSSGCALLGGTVVSLGVPFVPQDDNYCGSTALEMVLKYEGVSFDGTSLRNAVQI